MRWIVFGWWYLKEIEYNDENLFRESSKHKNKQQFSFHHVPFHRHIYVVINLNGGFCRGFGVWHGDDDERDMMMTMTIYEQHDSVIFSLLSLLWIVLPVETWSISSLISNGFIDLVCCCSLDWVNTKRISVCSDIIRRLHRQSELIFCLSAGDALYSSFRASIRFSYLYRSARKSWILWVMATKTFTDNNV